VRFLRRKPAEHHAAVYDTQPLPGDKNQFEPYFVAICSCDWLGGIRESREEAFRDAFGHTENVDEEVKRPVG